MTPRPYWLRALTAHPKSAVMAVASLASSGCTVRPLAPAQEGLALLTLRDAVFGERFHLGEVPLGEARVEVTAADGRSGRGAARVLDDDAELAVALAVCDAVLAHDLPGAAEVRRLVEDGAVRRDAEDARRRALLDRTRVDFALLSSARTDEEDDDAH
jgi:alpha-D-ribose 1-methylphosphonate 5-triphosphate synthase subunit PhnG